MLQKAIVYSTIGEIMTEPKFDCERADEAFYGMVVDIIDIIDNEWFKVRTHYNYEGYMHTSRLILDVEDVQMWLGRKKSIIVKSFADILNKPEVQGVVMATITRGGIISIEEDDETTVGWTKVCLADGRIGFTKTAYIGEYIDSWNIEDEEKLRDNFVATALTYLGTQYRWGGKSPLGIDCSGLCSVAYMLNGVIIHRDASIKSDFCMVKIDPKDIKKGDLLFFPGHVAMYMGNDKFIHSTGYIGSDGVVINSINPNDEDSRMDLVAKMKYAGTIFHK